MMSKLDTISPTSSATPGWHRLKKTPPLEQGDRLTRAEFERRYHAMPYVNKAELIEGVVYMPSPVHFRSHSKPHAHVITWLGTYSAATPGVQLGDNATVRLDRDNEVQPDVLLRLDEKHNGRSRISSDDYVEGPPELIVEIAASSASYDLYDKRKVYRRNGVQEYAIWQIFDERLDWFALENDEYVPLQPDENGIIRSRVFSGLWLAAQALLNDDLATVLQTAQQGLASPEHAAFIAQLSAS